MTATVVRLLAAFSAGVGAWCSLGVVAVTHTGGRLGLLPPLWGLGAAIIAAGVLVVGLRWQVSRSLPLFASLLFVLPWLPGTTVAPFLLFSGPIVWLWWSIIGLACLIAAPAASLAGVLGVLRDPRRAPWIAGGVVAVVATASAVNLQSRLPAGDEPHYLVITQSLLADGDLRIENNHRQGDYFAYHPGELPPDYLRRGADRQIYSIHAPGLPAVVAPAFALGGYAGVVAFLVVCGALGAALAWWLGYRMTRDPGAAWVGWAVVASSATFVVHTFVVFPDGLSGACVLAGLWALFLRPATPPWRFAALGAVTALLPWLHTRNAPMALVVGLAVVWALVRARAWRAGAAWLAPLSLSALSWLAFFKVIYGAFDPSAPYGGYTQSSLANVTRGITGLLFDQQFGLLAYAPALAIGLVGLWHMVAARTPAPDADRALVSARSLAVIVLTAVVPYAVLAASYAMWWGGASAPARFLAPLVLPLAIPAAVAWHRGGRAARAVAVGLIATSSLVLGALVSQQHGAMAFNVRDGFAALADWASPAGDLSLALPALHRDPVAVAAVRAVLWAMIPIACWAVGAVLVRRRPGLSRGALALALILTAGLSTMAVASGAWTGRGVRGVRIDASQVRLLEAVAASGDGSVPVTFRDAQRNDGFGRTERTTKRIPRDDLVARLSLTTTLRRPPRDAAFGAGPLPAGKYRLRVSTRDVAAGPLDIAIGRNGRPLRRLTWDGATGTAMVTTEFDLPVPIGLLTVRGDAPAISAVTRTVLQPLQVRARDRRLGREDVQGVAPNGGLVAYLLSDALYIERDGMWIRPNVDVPMVVEREGAPAEGPLRVFLRNGPFENEIELRGTTRASWTLAPNEERVVAIDVTWIDGAARISVRASRGFRPGEVDPASADLRLLGVWVAFP